MRRHKRTSEYPTETKQNRTSSLFDSTVVTVDETTVCIWVGGVLGEEGVSDNFQLEQGLNGAKLKVISLI